MAESALDYGMDSLGFSGHGYTPYDLRYCMKDTEGYMAEIKALKKEMGDKIRIYLGIEEDAFSLCDRQNFDYIIGSCHYLLKDGSYYPIDSNFECFKKCLELFSYDEVALSESYYSNFCSYILSRRPDIIGHFDLVTKFDDMDGGRFLTSSRYLELADRYTRTALEAECIFEVNTGAISRGYRTTPYPHERLLHIIKKEGGRVTLSSDSHAPDTLLCGYKEAIALLKDVGIDSIWNLTDDGFKKEYI